MKHTVTPKSMDGWIESTCDKIIPPTFSDEQEKTTKLIGMDIKSLLLISFKPFTTFVALLVVDLQSVSRYRCNCSYQPKGKRYS